MYWKGPDDDDDVLKQDILDDIEKYGGEIGYIISSSEPIPSSNKPGDNPPHAKAAARYREIAPSGFLCTGEHLSEEAPEPIVLELGDEGLKYRQPRAETSEAKKVASLRDAAAIARGSNKPPTESVGSEATNDRGSSAGARPDSRH